MYQNFFNQKYSSITLWLGVFLYLVFQLGYLGLTLSKRHEPIEVDDAYSYIVKASQLTNCPLQDCRALDDLERQITPTTDNASASNKRFRIYHRLFTIYHPLHSLSIASLHSIGLPWTTSYNLIQFLGSILLCLAIAFLLQTIWNSHVAGISLVFIGATIYAGQGIHTIVPSNISMAISWIAWGAILRYSKVPVLTVVLLSAVAIGMHQMGMLFTLVSIGLLLFKFHFDKTSKNSRQGKTLFICTASLLLLIITVYSIKHFTALPLFKGIPDQAETGWTYLQGTREILEAMFTSFNTWLSLTNWKEPGYWIVLLATGILAVVGYTSAETKTKRNLLMLSVLLLPLLLLDFSFLYKNHPGMIFKRIFLLPAFLITSAVVAGMLVLLSLARSVLNDFDNGPGIQRLFDSKFNNRPFRLILTVILISLPLQFCLHYSLNKLRHLKYRHLAYSERYNFEFDKKQVEMLIEEIDKDKSVLYVGEMPLYYYLAHGCWDLGAVEYSSVAHTAQESEWIDIAGKNIEYIVSLNPFKLSLYDSPDGIDITNKTEIIVSFDREVAVDSICFKIHASDPLPRLKILATNDKYSIKNTLEYDLKVLDIRRKMILVSLNKSSSSGLDKINRIEITNHSGYGKASIASFGISNAQSTQWPWGKDIAVELRRKTTAKSFRFDETEIIPLDKIETKVRSDDGYLLLQEIL